MNILNLKKKFLKKYVDPKLIKVGKVKYFPASTKEWFDSIYTYNKNTTKILPSINSFTFELIKSYFNVYSNKLEKSIKLPRIRKWKRRLLIRRFFLSRPELRHTNDKIYITIYVYNRQYNYLINKINKIKPKWLDLYKKKNIYNQYILALNMSKKIFYYLNTFNVKINLGEDNKKKFLKRFLKKLLKKEIFFMKWKKMIAFNKSRFKDAYLKNLTNILEKMYKKKIQFNLITLKNYYLNSDIFTQIVATKLKNKRNRGKALKILERSIFKVKIPFLRKYNTVVNKYLGKQNVRIKNFIDLDTKHANNSICSDGLDKVLKKKFIKNTNLRDFVLKSTKLKTISGVKVEASGRLTKRIKAQRSIQKYKQAGTLRNMFSSSVILRGNKKSNIQYTMLSSKTRIGAFGLKGWVSAY